jgi:ATP-dependent exoDNAse (exonuclease V) alpha subunit
LTGGGGADISSRCSAYSALPATGKSTLALEIGSWARSPVYACFTGKAASVLRERGEVPATTLHSLLYASVYDRETDTFHHTRRPRDPGIDLLVIDEASMVDQRLGADVVALRVPTLVLADPFQLPPISGTGFFMRVRPDARLSEIHRQAQGHPIVGFADRIRRGEFAGVRGRLRPRDSSPDEKVRIVKGCMPGRLSSTPCCAEPTPPAYGSTTR